MPWRKVQSAGWVEGLIPSHAGLPISALRPNISTPFEGDHGEEEGPSGDKRAAVLHGGIMYPFVGLSASSTQRTFTLALEQMF